MSQCIQGQGRCHWYCSSPSPRLCMYCCCQHTGKTCVAMHPRSGALSLVLLQPQASPAHVLLLSAHRQDLCRNASKVRGAVTGTAPAPALACACTAAVSTQARPVLQCIQGQGRCHWYCSSPGPRLRMYCCCQHTGKTCVAMHPRSGALSLVLLQPRPSPAHVLLLSAHRQDLCRNASKVRGAVTGTAPAPGLACACTAAVSTQARPVLQCIQGQGRCHWYCSSPGPRLRMYCCCQHTGKTCVAMHPRSGALSLVLLQPRPLPAHVLLLSAHRQDLCRNASKVRGAVTGTDPAPALACACTAAVSTQARPLSQCIQGQGRCHCYFSSPRPRLRMYCMDLAVVVSVI